MATSLKAVGLDLDRTVTDLMSRDTVPGVALGILDGDQHVTAAWGIANRDTAVPMTPTTVLQIGSISKVFTASLLMGLVDEGRVDLDTPVSQLLPGFRLGDEAATATITPRHCLTHTGGFDGDRFDDHGRGDDALARCVDGYMTLRQQLPPGTTFSYCNTGFNVIGRVIEAVTDQPFEDTMRERVFAPLGLRRATFFADEAILMRAAAGHLGGDRPGTVRLATPWPLARNANPAGGIIADVEALLRFAAAHLDGTVDGNAVVAPFPGEASRAAMRRTHVAIDAENGRGLGWATDTTRAGEPAFGHDGATNGFKASLRVYPERRFAIALLTNGDMSVYTNRDLEREILRQRFGIAVADPVPVAPAGGLAGRVSGLFRAMLSELTIAGSDDALTATLVSHNPFNGEVADPVTMRVAPIGERELMVTEGVRAGLRVQLLPGTDGRIDMVRAGGRIAVRTAPDAPDRGW